MKKNNNNSSLIYSLLKRIEENGGYFPARSYVRHEPRTIQNDYSKALSFEVFDPMWMLCRQWQFGRFAGNDCGTAIGVKVHSTRTPVNIISDGVHSEQYSKGKPLEYCVEKMDSPITPIVRIDSAIHFLKTVEVKHDKSFAKEANALLMSLCPLDDFTVKDAQDLEELKIQKNERLVRLWTVYGRRLFDGYKLFSESCKIDNPKIEALLPEYRNWFRNKYLKDSSLKNDVSCFDERKMGYSFEIKTSGSQYTADNYGNGRLSWFNFDLSKRLKKDASGKVEKKLFYIPSPIVFPGAPNRKLWQFEDRNVQFGNFSNEDVTQLASSVIMQYVSMYSNDWMVIPLEAEVGQVLDVTGIVVKDTFGEYIYIDKNPDKFDSVPKEIGYSYRWSMFENSRDNAFDEDDFSTESGIIFAPTVLRTEESEPLEEIQFLRDEMTNMIWGVENIIPDGCGGYFHGKDFSEQVMSGIDGELEDVTGDKDSEYSFLVQNRVPLNWIPFIPQKIKGETRDIVFRRGRMPIWFNGKYDVARPNTVLLSIKRRSDNSVVPMYLNEEEIQSYGTKVIRTAQRARWFKGSSFNWIGISKKDSQYQANSGLMFDELRAIEK